MEATQNNRVILTALVQVEPEYFTFSENFPVTPLTIDEENTLLADTLTFIGNNGGEAHDLLQALQENSTGIKSTGAEVAVLVGVAFLLRSHLKLRRSKDGEWEFLVEHKPSDSDLLGSLLSRLQALFGKR